MPIQTASPPPPTSTIPLAQHIPTLLFLTLTVLVSTLITRAQPTPYIDEIFHIPQAQRFCSTLLASTHSSSVGELWNRLRAVGYDSKLTTPPGLYAISVGLAKVLPGWRCDEVSWLRSTNLVLLLTLPVLVSRVLRQNEEHHPLTPPLQDTTTGRKPTRAGRKAVSRKEIEELQQKAQSEAPPTPEPDHPYDDQPPPPQPIPIISVGETSTAGTAATALPIHPKRREATPHTMALACTICFLPPLWFFGFLYYTDLASVWLMLACSTLYHELNTRTRTLSTSVLIVLASVLAVGVRQTNLVWVIYCGANATLDAVLRVEPSTERVLAEQGLVEQIRAVLDAARRREFWRRVMRNAMPMLPMVLGCAWFIRWNGSIVLGDRTNHQAGMHFPQLGYLLLFSSAFGLFPLLSTFNPSSTPTTTSCSAVVIHSTITASRTVLRKAIGTPARSALFTALFTLSWAGVDRFTIDHPFLLADNRHYTFYLWRIFRTPLYLRGKVVEVKFLLVPVYVLALYAWGIALSRKGRGGLRAVLLAGASAATLVPTPLVEVRYYLIPYLLLRLGVQGNGRERWVFLALEFVLYAVVNAITVGLFVGRTFEWHPEAVDRSRGEGTTMRFIW